MTASAAKIAYGSVFQWNSQSVAELTKIGGIEISAKTAEITSHDSANAFEEHVPTILSGGSFDLEGNLRVDDTNGQVAMLADEVTKTMRAWTITYPSAVGAAWGGNGYITKFKLGDANFDGILTFTATIINTGKPSLTITSAAGLTTPFFTVTGTGGASAIAPAAAAASLEYVVNLAAGSTSYYVTPTASGATSIVIRDNTGNEQTVISGANSTSIAAPTNSMHTIYIIVKETGKVNKTYTLRVSEPV